MPTSSRSRSLLLGAAALVAVLAFLSAAVPASADPFGDLGIIRLPGDPALGFSLPDLQGKKVSLKDFRGKVVLLYFWATW